MLLKNAQLIDPGSGTTAPADVRIDGSRIERIGALPEVTGEQVLDAGGNALIPGLHDHHVHFLSYAASLISVHCGPPAVNTAGQLRNTLAAAPGDGWLRGYGYHESVAGEIDRNWLDSHGPARPVRLQHRTGRLWIVNSLGLTQLRAAAPDTLTRDERQAISAANGRLFDSDALLRRLIDPDLSMVDEASRKLSAFGVTGIDDMTPSNSPETFTLFDRLMEDGRLRQQVRMSGTPALSTVVANERLGIGCTKIHLHETQLPAFDELCALIASSHVDERRVAVHCVTETELVFTLAAFRSAGTIAGDRIEHASVTPPALITQLRELSLTVVTQPGFVFERGDAYLAEMAKDEHDRLYRAKTLLDAGIDVAFATDMPFSDANPWRAMQAAVNRRTADGNLLGEGECVTPEFALGAFLGEFDDVGRPRHVHEGGKADLCLLDRPWQTARDDLAAVQVTATILDGQLIHHRP